MTENDRTAAPSVFADAPMSAAARRTLALRAFGLGVRAPLQLYGEILIRVLAWPALGLAALYALLSALEWADIAGPVGPVVASLLEPGPFVWAAIGLPLAYIATDLYYRVTGDDPFRVVLAHLTNWGAPRLGLDVPSKGRELAERLRALRRYLRVAIAIDLICDFGLALVIAAALSWGLATALGPELLFAPATTPTEAAAFGNNFLFWLWHVVDLLLLEAPSAFGWRFGPLEARPDGYAFLTLVLAFRIAIILTLARSLPFLLGKPLTPTALTPQRVSAHVEAVLPEMWAPQGPAASEAAAGDDGLRSAQT